MRTFQVCRPTPALVVSLIALIVALGGTAYAGFTIPKNSVGTKQLKNGAVTTKKIKNGTVTASKINTSGLTVPNALHANTADTAGSAATAGTANSATHASTADTATEANGLPALNWVPLVLQNGWQAEGSTVPAVAIDAQGVVHFRGKIHGGTSGGFATLPAQFILSDTVFMAADEFSADVGFVAVNSLGGASVLDDPDHPGSSFVFTSLDGLTYALS
jgi:hypothetical protein